MTIGQLLLLEKGHRQKRFAEQPLTFEQPSLFHRAKTVVKCISAGQSTGHRTIGQLLLQKGSLTKDFCRVTSDTPSKHLVKTRPRYPLLPITSQNNVQDQVCKLLHYTSSLSRQLRKIYFGVFCAKKWQIAITAAIFRLSEMKVKDRVKPPLFSLWLYFASQMYIGFRL